MNSWRWNKPNGKSRTSRKNEAQAQEAEQQHQQEQRDINGPPAPAKKSRRKEQDDVPRASRSEVSARIVRRNVQQRRETPERPSRPKGNFRGQQKPYIVTHLGGFSVVRSTVLIHNADLDPQSYQVEGLPVVRATAIRVTILYTPSFVQSMLINSKREEIGAVREIAGKRKRWKLISGYLCTVQFW
ncbi:unnamed protein product [Bursaphelenchus xylophilus]|uniref:(pine wood nematode) hypothetical protein n=1 Tax=Bursaphelenchus xylophilus TaxID=6326 RepID=A0A1I7RUG8_BURXY|nr:unnamed protein product [Bursaphelenchus xylophilus]CAG9114118.1 unnamed protein product [Bursaphelenchus xylophilus]